NPPCPSFPFPPFQSSPSLPGFLLCSFPIPSHLSAAVSNDHLRPASCGLLPFIHNLNLISHLRPLSPQVLLPPHLNPPSQSTFLPHTNRILRRQHQHLKEQFRRVRRRRLLRRQQLLEHNLFR